MWWSPWSRDVAYMTSHSSVIRSGRLTALSKDRSSIGLSILPPSLTSLTLYPRLRNKWATEHTTLWIKLGKHVCRAEDTVCVAGTHWSLVLPQSSGVEGKERETFCDFIGLNKGCPHYCWGLARESTAEAATKKFFRITLRLERQVGRGGTEKERKNPFQNYLCILFNIHTIIVSPNNIPAVSVPHFIWGRQEECSQSGGKLINAGANRLVGERKDAQKM